MRKKAPKNLILEGVGLNLGRVWDALGSPVVTFGRILTLFWTFKVISCKRIGPRWTPRGLLDGIWVALERFWDGLGRVWEEFGRVWSLWSKEWTDFGYAWHDLALLQQSL